MGASAAPVPSQSHTPSLCSSSSPHPPSSILLWAQEAALQTNSPGSPAPSFGLRQAAPPPLPRVSLLPSLPTSSPGHWAPQYLLESPFSLLTPLQMAQLLSSPQMTQFEGAISCQGLSNTHPVPKTATFRWPRQLGPPKPPASSGTSCHFSI